MFITAICLLFLLLPTTKELLEPQLLKDVRERKLQRKEVQTRYFNRNVTEGEVARMKPQASNGKQRWAKAQVQQQKDIRSYAVRTEDGRFFRRNRRRHLRQSKEQFVAKDADFEILSSVTVHQLKSTPNHQQLQDRTAQEAQHLCAVSKQA